MTKNKVIFAFPGMGKTPAAKRLGNFIDLDFGHFREAHLTRKEDEGQLIPAFMRLIMAYYQEGWNVLTNEPKLILPIKAMLGGNANNIRVILPDVKEASSSHSKSKLGMTQEEFEQAVQGWVKIAHANGIQPRFITIGLDHYLEGRKL